VVVVVVDLERPLVMDLLIMLQEDLVVVVVEHH
jgi:hypothetical protein